MITFTKQREPDSLAQYRAMPGAAFDGPDFTPVKNETRKRLLDEQGYICAYCMQRIQDDPLKMKIEHWHCQSRYPGEDLDYANLLACCMGGQGQPHQHCDTHKADQDLHYHPARHGVQGLIRYPGDGTITSDDADMQADIETLNLNGSPFMKANRRAVIDEIIKKLGSSPGSRTRAEIHRLIRKYTERDAENCLNAFCGVAIYYLQKKLRSTSQ